MCSLCAHAMKTLHQCTVQYSQFCFSLRELDLSLLSQLWSLNESIQEFRQMQEAFSPPSPSSDVEDDIIYSNLSALPEHQAYPLSSSSSRSSTMDLGDV
ncbi:uncharacterized protein LOC124356815 isoform X3 [Homalodisca vitripennis]|uniref:uncharacterized protein LOC124356815 isoform X3 n=1 Tax=Homalodisca vitripennis TaxID=197043 RepID=UPI001EEC94FF|nr:uncharacterized protein LOC124356815 isoform X3 [Homalodisca vitripennis]